MLTAILAQLRNDQFDPAGSQPEWRRGWNAHAQHTIRLIERFRVPMQMAADYASACELEEVRR